MKKHSWLIVLFLLLVSCNEPSTPNPAEVSLTMIADRVNAEATQAKLASVFTVTAQVVGATATQQAIWVEATAVQQARIDAESTAAQDRADTQATADQARRDAQATQQRIDSDAATSQARIDQEATAQQGRMDAQSTQQASGTSTAFVITQTAIPPANTMTAIAQHQDIQLKDNQVELSNLQVEQQAEKNTPQWLIPYLVAIVVLVIGAIYVIRYSRVREVKNDDGELEMVGIGNKWIRPRLLPGPVLHITKDGITMPLLTAAAEQSKVTERAQAVEAIKNMPPSTTPQAAQTFNKYFAPPQDLPFDVIDADDAPPAGLLDGETLKTLNKDWKEAKGEQ